MESQIDVLARKIWVLNKARRRLMKALLEIRERVRGRRVRAIRSR